MARRKIVVITPTYNERENIGPFIDSLQREFEKMADETHLLIVDDESPDGTADVVRDKISEYENIHLLTGRKEGLGSAYIRGMRYAVDVLHGDVVMEMDADFSHRPEDIPRLISALSENTDFVIGSRYVKGGTVPHDWGMLRKMNSRWGNIFARYIAGLRNVRDCTAGFRAIRASVLKQINLSDLGVQGYAFQVALLHRAVANGAVVREIPVEFVDRTRGETKLSLSDIVEFIVNVWWIRLESSKTFLKFSAVGASGVLVNLGGFTLLMEAGVNKFVASPVAIELSIVSNFLLNNSWTFSSRNAKGSFHLKGLKFNIVSFVSLGVSYSIFVLLSLLFPHTMPQIHQAIGIVPATIINYGLNSYWTFK